MGNLARCPFKIDNRMIGDGKGWARIRNVFERNFTLSARVWKGV